MLKECLIFCSSEIIVYIRRVRFMEFSILIFMLLMKLSIFLVILIFWGFMGWKNWNRNGFICWCILSVFSIEKFNVRSGIILSRVVYIRFMVCRVS